MKIYAMTKSEFLIFDDPAESKTSQRPLREGKLSNPHARAARAACMEKIYEIPRAREPRASCAGFVLFKSTVPG